MGQTAGDPTDSFRRQGLVCFHSPSHLMQTNTFVIFLTSLPNYICFRMLIQYPVLVTNFGRPVSKCLLLIPAARATPKALNTNGLGNVASPQRLDSSLHFRYNMSERR